jgi:hypothetical protein
MTPPQEAGANLGFMVGGRKLAIDIALALAAFAATLAPVS